MKALGTKVELGHVLLFSTGILPRLDPASMHRVNQARSSSQRSHRSPRAKTRDRTKNGSADVREQKTFLESLTRPDRELLLRFAGSSTAAPSYTSPNLSNTSRLEQELAGHEHELFGDENNMSAEMGMGMDDAQKVANACLNAPAMYMKTIWDLRHRLQAASTHGRIVEERLKAREEDVTKLQQKLAHGTKEHGREMAALAAQLERLISENSAKNDRVEAANTAYQRAKEQLDASQAGEERLRELLRIEMQKAEKRQEIVG